MTVEPADNRVAPNDSWTVKRVLDWTIQHLSNHGCDSPRLDSEILLAHARGCQRIELYTRYEDVLSDGERTTMRDLVQRRANSEPVAYLVGRREFFGLDMRVTPDVLIPRPDTEMLVIEVLDVAKKFAAPRILDLGSGSGCIAIAIAVNNRTSNLMASDISTAALSVARQNADDHDVAGHIEFIHSDLFTEIEGQAKFDMIVSNPPYVTQSELAGLQPDVRLHEPVLALDGGQDGLDVIRRIVADAASYLTDGGTLLLEIDSSQAQAVTEIIRSTQSYSEVSLRNDLAGRARVIRTRKRI